MCQRGLVSTLPFALLLALVTQVSAASPCNDLSIEEEGILCDEVDGECKCGRPCDVYKSNVFKACSALAVKQVGLSTVILFAWLKAAHFPVSLSSRLENPSC